MKSTLFIFILSGGLFLTRTVPGFSQVEKGNQISIHYTSMVFHSGLEQYAFYRIPSLMTDGHHLYAFSEGRKNGVGDNGEIDLVLKISPDAGHGWGSLIQVTDYKGQSCQNPTPVYIQEENKILLLFTKRTVADDTEQEIRDGTSQGYVGAYLTESLDHGITWSRAREITDQVKPNNWRWYAFGPGGAVVLEKGGPYQGRIVIPANHSTGEVRVNEDLGAHVVYSDDRGESWQVGACDSEGLGTVHPNELTILETNTGTLYFNTRNQNNQPDPLGNRAITYSRDGGISFVRKFFHEPQLTTPVVHASLARLDDEIVFIAPSDKKERINLSLWISYDETLTWSRPYLLQTGWSAYSSTVKLNKEKVGILYETGKDHPYQEIRFMVISQE